jgi:hypothetical protein
MAHWGIAMTSFQPLWHPTSEEDLERGRAAAEKARALGAPTERERAHIAAASAFFTDPAPPASSRPRGAGDRLGGGTARAARGAPRGRGMPPPSMPWRRSPTHRRGSRPRRSPTTPGSDGRARSCWPTSRTTRSRSRQPGAPRWPKARSPTTSGPGASPASSTSAPRTSISATRRGGPRTRSRMRSSWSSRASTTSVHTWRRIAYSPRYSAPFARPGEIPVGSGRSFPGEKAGMRYGWKRASAALGGVNPAAVRSPHLSKR